MSSLLSESCTEILWSYAHCSEETRCKVEARKLRHADLKRNRRKEFTTKPAITFRKMLKMIPIVRRRGSLKQNLYPCWRKTTEMMCLGIRVSFMEISYRHRAWQESSIRVLYETLAWCRRQKNKNGGIPHTKSCYSEKYFISLCAFPRVGKHR